MERMSEEDLAKFVAESKYSITLKEWSHLKKRIKFLVNQHSEKIDLRFHKDGDECRVTLILSPDFTDLIESYFRRLSHNSSLIFSDEAHNLKAIIMSELRHHDITFSERDSMSDYAGSYRFHPYCSIEFNPSSKQVVTNLEAMIGELVNSKKNTSISLDEFLAICEKHELSKEYVTKLYNQSLSN